MSGDLNKKQSWFMEAEQCDYCGLEITHPESFVCGVPESDFRVNIARLGRNMILVKAYGYITSFLESEMQAFIDDFIARRFKPEDALVYIEDYIAVTGADAEARKKYITYLKNHSDFIGIILFSLSPVFKVSFNLAKKLRIYSATAHAVNCYEEAIDLARSLTGETVVPRPSANDESGLSEDIKNRLSSANAGVLPGGLFQRISSRLRSVNDFFIQKAKQQYKEELDEELIQFIASIDWKTQGLPLKKNIQFNDVPSKKVFDAISFVKSEIDNMMEERSKAEAVLRESETRYRLLVAHAKAGFLEYDYKNNKIISVNDEFVRMTGYSESELLGRDPMELMTKESQNMLKQRRAQVITDQSVPQDVIYQIITKDNERRWLLLNSNVTYHDNFPAKASVVVTDITQFKETENQLLEYQEKLKRLSVRLSMAEEDQRRSMASRLHETIGQELFVMQLQLAAFEKSIDNPALFEGVKQINDQLLKIIKETKSLTFDLSPPVLYDLGFSEAMKTLAQIVKQKHNIDVKTAFEGDMDVIDNEIKVILYRNIKELIHNTIKHAKAQNISIRFKNCRAQLHVEFRDDGIGFDAAGDTGAASVKEGFGLFDIREKLNHLGGRLIINSMLGQGASVSMQVPLNFCAD